MRVRLDILGAMSRKLAIEIDTGCVADIALGRQICAMLTHVRRSYSQWLENIDKALQEERGPWKSSFAILSSFRSGMINRTTRFRKVQINRTGNFSN